MSETTQEENIPKEENTEAMNSREKTNIQNNNEENSVVDENKIMTELKNETSEIETDLRVKETKETDTKHEKMEINEEKTEESEEYKSKCEKIEAEENKNEENINKSDKIEENENKSEKMEMEEIKSKDEANKPSDEAIKLSDEANKPLDEAIKLSDEANKPSDEVNKPSDEVNKPSDEAIKPSDEVNKPSDEANKPSDEAIKPSDEANKPSDEVNKPSDEANKPSDEVNKPSDEANKPSDEVNKPSNEANKPSDEANKPSDEVNKPSDEANKPSDEVNKPSDEANKPSDEAIKPSNEAIKPSDEVNKPSDEVNKPSDEVNKPSDDANKPSDEANKPSDEANKTSDEANKPSDAPEFSAENKYELIDGHYYYTDENSGTRYRYSAEKGDWVDVREESVTDSEGRTYYYAENLYLCRDKEGSVFFMNEAGEWQAWGERSERNERSESTERKNQDNWYFYQGEDTFYRDKKTGVIFKLNKIDNKWEKFEGKLSGARKRKRPRNEDEEFDTSDEEEEEEEEDEDGLTPPGAANDPNISFDGAMFTKVDPSDGMKYEWDADRRAWFPKVDEDFMATYQLSYGFNPDGTVNENPLKFDDDEEEEEEARRKEEEEAQKAKEKGKQKKKPTWFEIDESTNTKVYVSNLPDDMNEEEFITLMQKCGMLLLNPDTGKPKVKLYHDKEGNFKGDALCSYIKIESVELAEQILDDYEVGGRRIHVEKAKFELKGEYNPKLKPRKKTKKEMEKIQKRQEKLFEWRPDPLRGERHKWEKTVVIRNAFDPREFHCAMEKILDHKQGIRNHCSNFGRIKKLELHDLHPDGVVQVTFDDVESADMCVATLNKRLYCGKTLSVTTWDGKQKFKIQETDKEREERLKKWDEFLEGKSS